MNKLKIHPPGHRRKITLLVRLIGFLVFPPPTFELESVNSSPCASLMPRPPLKKAE